MPIRKSRNGPQATLADIARSAGVSTATASRALNAPDRVSNDLKDRVEEAVRELGYVRHGAARALASRRSHTIGAVIPTLNNAIFAAGVGAFEARLTEAGYTLLIAVSNYSLENEAHQVRKLLERGVDGIMLVGLEHHDETYALLERSRLPHVNTWTCADTDARLTIGFDNAASARAIANHLISLGHTRIAMAAGITAGNDRAQARVDGVRAELAAHGLSLEESHLLECPYSIASGREALNALMTRDPKPTAIIAGNDVIALGLLFEAIKRGIDVPSALSITGFDNLPITAHVSPAMTTVNVPSFDMGTQAASLLLDAIDGADTASIRLETSVVVRETTAPPPSGSAPAVVSSDDEKA